MSFSLVKWYFDVATPDGGVAIAYCAEVRWGVLRQPFSGVLVLPAGGAHEPWRFSGRAVEEPLFGDRSLRWGSEPLELAVEYLHGEPPFQERLYEGREGFIDWRCVTPRARARVRVGDTVLEGLGYAERLELTLLPWKIPADEIRWGRFIGGDASVVWIDWRGEDPQALAWLDGRAMPDASISDSSVRFGDAELRLVVDHVVSDDMLGGMLSPLEALQPLIEPITRTHQTRWLSRGELHGCSSDPKQGWVIHEVVRRR